MGQIQAILLFVLLIAPVAWFLLRQTKPKTPNKNKVKTPEISPQLQKRVSSEHSHAKQKIIDNIEKANEPADISGSDESLQNLLASLEQYDFTKMTVF